MPSEPLVQDVDDGAQDVVRVAAAVDDAVERLERARVGRRHADWSASPSKRRRSPGSRRGSARPPLLEVDEHERLLRRDHEHVVVDPVGRALVGRARAADACQTDEHLQQVVEARRRVVLDRAAPA